MEFDLKSVSEDEKAMTELEGLGTMTTPVTVVGDEVVVGFDREKLALVIGLERP